MADEPTFEQWLNASAERIDRRVDALFNTPEGREQIRASMAKNAIIQHVKRKMDRTERGPVPKGAHNARR
jgi:hypothetical protein